jgi:hypothetical protein
MSKRNKEARRRLEDDIELRNTFDQPIKAGKGSSPYEVPKEDRAVAAHSFASDIDQQKMLAQIRSEVAALREEVVSLSKRIERLEKS